MKSVKPWHSSKIPDASRIYKLMLAMFEKHINDETNEKLNVKSFMDENGSYFSVINLINVKDEKPYLYYVATAIISDVEVAHVNVKEFLDLITSDALKNLGDRCLYISNRSHDAFINKVFPVYTVDKQQHDTYMPPLELKSEDVELPDGYRFGSLTENDREHIVGQWMIDISCTDDKNMDRARNNLLNRPYVAVFYKSERYPVGWMFTYLYGIIGGIHVKEAHRRRGLARKMIRKLYKTVKELYGVAPPVRIDSKNKPESHSLFVSEGWVKDLHSSCTMFSCHNNTAE